MSSEPNRRNRWPVLFQQAKQAIFVLSASKRIRFVNPAWETLTGYSNKDSVGKACLQKGPTEDLFRTLAPPSEAKLRMVSVRKTPPNKSAGPPWWDITFTPLTSDDDTVGYLGMIQPTSGEASGAKGIVPETVGNIRLQHGQSFTYDLFASNTIRSEKLVNQLRLAAAHLSPIWITGGQGSGKETAARVVHCASTVKDRAFFTWDCSAIPVFLSESMLFGRGSFGESGRLGTLFLKEPTTLPRDAQIQLIQWLDKHVNKVRLIVSSKFTAEQALNMQAIVPDLASRYAVTEIKLPSLQERSTELPQIVERISKRIDRVVSPEAMKVLQLQTWPGNIRELADVLAHAEGTETIFPEHLPRLIREKAQLADMPITKAEAGFKLDEVLENVEKKLLRLALDQNHDNATKAAEWLGIARTRFLRRAEQLKVKEEQK
jgi:transcriptional regulator with PAS, ATPase and Fis domain